jgi:hypothetical protein
MTEMYDSTLDLRLIRDDDGKPFKYINTLTLKGPSPESNPLSWDKLPLTNGVRYSWEGVIDNSNNAIPGISQEAGFGVNFPNYIVDVAGIDDGHYQELIQFQCIEVGGIRLYEGKDFMSRTPQLSDTALDAMHERRATAAGLDPYGSSHSYMHRGL